MLPPKPGNPEFVKKPYLNAKIVAFEYAHVSSGISLLYVSSVRPIPVYTVQPISLYLTSSYTNVY